MYKNARKLPSSEETSSIVSASPRSGMGALSRSPPEGKTTFGKDRKNHAERAHNNHSESASALISSPACAASSVACAAFAADCVTLRAWSISESCFSIFIEPSGERLTVVVVVPVVAQPPTNTRNRMAQADDNDLMIAPPWHASIRHMA